MSSPQHPNTEKVRLDKWLWVVRVFKTRNMATLACNAGKVKMDGQSCKPSKEVRKGDILQIRVQNLLKTVKVVDFPKSRIAAKLVPDFYTDLTPQEEYEKLKNLRSQTETREHGIGRPTKRDRRQLEYVKNLIKNDTDWEDD
ncbi:MAG: RNA-binding S4 domain-containing protein [Bacteroidales bacterium]|jgi:ribosome-associated heat shock protein Hsp15|nr:RNA-binding S4 domain-containing protein [Bacteroidales bacterium]